MQYHPSSQLLSRAAIALATAVLTAVIVSGGAAALAQEVRGIVGANSVNSNSIINNTVQGIDIKDGTVATADLTNNGVRGIDILNGQINSGDLRDNNIQRLDLADGTVGSADLTDGGVGSVDVANESLTGAYIAANQIASSEIAANVVTADEVGTITRRQAISGAIANNSFGSAGVQCAAGEQVRAGGNDASTVGVGYTVLASRNDGANGWLVFIRKQTGANQTVAVYAYCLAP